MEITKEYDLVALQPQGRQTSVTLDPRGYTPPPLTSVFRSCLLNVGRPGLGKPLPVNPPIRLLTKSPQVRPQVRLVGPKGQSVGW